MLLKDAPAAQRRPRNVDAADRAARIIVGLALLAAMLLVPSAWRWFGLLGLVPLATGIAGWCPLYAWFARD
ncbi:MAG TPA: DUF2892 domain-containing protein [Burkholderiales bacterium]|nr:DUF2892 domain-containing protein [Burkholderiales bacterium]